MAVWCRATSNLLCNFRSIYCGRTSDARFNSGRVSEGTKMNLKSGPRVRKFMRHRVRNYFDTAGVGGDSGSKCFRRRSLRGYQAWRCVLQGHSFRAPPIGLLRWKAPQPVVGWSGVKRADAFAEPCAQSSDEGVQGGEASAPTIRPPSFPSPCSWEQCRYWHAIFPDVERCAETL